MNGRFRYISLLVILGTLGGAALIFAQLPPYVESPIVTVTTPGPSGCTSGTVYFNVKVGSQVLTSLVDNNNCISQLARPAGGDIINCISSPVTKPFGTYSLTWVSGYPKGADTGVPPTVTPSSVTLSSSVCSATFTMAFQSKEPYVDLKVNGSDGPVSAGSAPVSVTVSWTTKPNQFSSCSASGAWVGAKDVNGSSEVVSILSNGTHTFAIDCIKQADNSHLYDTVTVNVGTSVIVIPPSAHLECRDKACVSVPGAGSNQCASDVDCGGQPPKTAPNPTVDLKVSNSDGPVKVLPNDTVVLTWSSADASSCRASSNPAGVWSGSKSTQSPAGGERSVPITADTVFTLTCYGPGGASSDSTTVNLGYGTRGFEEF